MQNFLLICLKLHIQILNNSFFLNSLTKEVSYLDDGDVCVLTKDKIEFFDKNKKKIKKKIKSGELKESELIEEASELVKKMRDMPGMENIQSMLGKMGIPNMAGFGGRNAKVNMGAVQSQLDKNLKLAKTKERMKQRLNENQTNVKIEKTSISKEEEEKEAAILKLLNSGKDGDIENLILTC